MALALARREGGVVINADSMQVYDGLRLLTARPSDEDMAAVPHRLYGHVPPSRPYSVGAWIRDVEKLAGTGELADRPAVFVGGTGLYFRALCEGLAAIPEIPQSIRMFWRARLRDGGAESLHRALGDRDAAAAASLRPEDGQRIVRALEVVEATGRSILDWQAESGRPLVESASARKFVIEPDRAALARRIDSRFGRMVAEGALDEARRLGTLRLDRALPAMKAIGLRQLLRAASGEIPLEQAAGEAKAASRQYAKRQATWFRHQLNGDWPRISNASLDAT